MKSNKTKSVMTALVVAAMVCTVAMPVKAAESQWINDNGTWSYVKEDGSKAKGWIKDNGCWYAFDESGSMRTGWVASHEHWYFMGESGVMQSNAWVEENGARYFIKGTGVMAKDYVKDGYELTSDGKAIPLAETNSVVVTDPSAVEGQVIEGNLYVDVTTAKELELKGVTVKGKLVIIGDNQTAGKVTVTDSKIEAISTQTRNAEVVLSGETAVKEIVIEETSAVTPDKNFKGEVEKIEVQSTTKGEIKIEVPAQEVSTRTYASVDIQAPVEHLEVKTDTQVKVNADVKNVVVTESAKDTKVEVSKGNTVGTIVADAPVKIEGSGTIEKVEANVDGVEAGKDTIIKDVETGKDVTTAPEVSKPEKPSTGGGSTGGGSTGGSGGGTTTPTKTEAEKFKEAFKAELEKLQTPREDVAVTVDNMTIDGNIKNYDKSVWGFVKDAFFGIVKEVKYDGISSVVISDLENSKTTGTMSIDDLKAPTTDNLTEWGLALFGVETADGLRGLQLAAVEGKTYKISFKLSGVENAVEYTLHFSNKEKLEELHKKMSAGIDTLNFSKLGLGDVSINKETINFVFYDTKTTLDNVKGTNIVNMLEGLIKSSGVKSYTFKEVGDNGGDIKITSPLSQHQDFIKVLTKCIGNKNLSEATLNDLKDNSIDVVIAYQYGNSESVVNIKYTIKFSVDAQTGASKHLAVLVDNAIKEFKTGENYDLSGVTIKDKNIDVEFSNGTKKITEISGTGIYEKVLPALMSGGVTSFTIGNKVIDNQTVNVKLLVSILSEYLGITESETITDKTVDELTKKEPMRVEVKFTDPKNDEQLNHTYYIKFSIKEESTAE